MAPALNIVRSSDSPPLPEGARITSGDEDLFGQLYDELRDLAAQKLGAERVDHTLEPTALVHEAWLRMHGLEPAKSWTEGRFRALAARVLRNVLIDHARGRNALRRGGGAGAVELPEPLTLVSADGDEVDVDELDRVLAELTLRSPRQAQVVEMRFFAGMPYADVAAALDVSVDTVKRDWRIARAWLNRALERGANGRAPARDQVGDQGAPQ